MALIVKFLSPLTIFSVFILDRLTKILIQKNIFWGETYEVFPFFHLTYLENTGAAFGWGQNQNKFFIFVSIAILIFIFFLRRKWDKLYPADLKLRGGLALVIGGALGNLYDRIRFGSVIDFLDFFIGPYHWPAFNVADSAICIGTFILVLAHWKTEPSGA